MSKTTLIISDTHLGKPGRVTAEALRPIWQGVDELVINGDVAELQIPWLRTAAVREIDTLDHLTRRDGVKLTFISGNHDAFLTDTRHLILAGGQILVMHGDALHPAVTPWTRSARIMRKMTKRALAELAPSQQNCLKTRLTIAQHVGHSEFLEDYVLTSHGQGGLSKALRRPWEVPHVLRYWGQEAGRAERFLERYSPETRILIFGHSHRPGVWRRGDRTLINTGAFTFPGRPWCVRLGGGEVQVHRLVKQGRVYQQHPKPVTTLTYDHEVDASGKTASTPPKHDPTGPAIDESGRANVA